MRGKVRNELWACPCDEGLEIRIGGIDCPLSGERAWPWSRRSSRLLLGEAGLRPGLFSWYFYSESDTPASR
jgi:hypothetical protein